LSFVAYRRVSTTIVTAGKGYGQGARQVVTIDPRDLEAAQEKDADIEISASPLAHGTQSMTIVIAHCGFFLFGNRRYQGVLTSCAA
jgi:hypothetical protein